jgi:nucleoside-diphosphate-sugar epimerase
MSIPELRNVPVLVTGGAGFIGSHLVDALLERGAKVRVLDNFLTGKRENLAHCIGQIDLIEGDLRDLDACHKACAGITYLFHEAALGSVPRSMKDPATTFAVNVSGTANVFTVARDASIQKVVYASSSSVYGDSETLPKREGEEGRPLSPYALSKVENERLAELFHRVFGMRVVGLRYFNVYGPRQDPLGPYAAVVPRFIAALRRGEAPVIYGDGEQSRDFTFVADVVRANLLALGAPAEAFGFAMNIAPGSRTTVNRLAAGLAMALGRSIAPAHEAPRPGDIADSQADAARAAQLLGWTAGTTLEEGLAKTAVSSWLPHASP